MSFQRIPIGNPVGIVEVGGELHKPTSRWSQAGMLDQMAIVPGSRTMKQKETGASGI